MGEVVVTRKFRLRNLNIPDDFFDHFKTLVNDQIRQGLQFDPAIFEKDSLVAVKRFYKELDNCCCILKERVHRCGGQFSYFSLREYRRNQKNLAEIITILLKNGYFKNSEEEILKKTDLSFFEIDNKIGFLKNILLKELDVSNINLQEFYNNAQERLKYKELLNSILRKSSLENIVKSFINKAVRKLNKRFKELQAQQIPVIKPKPSSLSNSNFDKSIFQILGLQNPGNVQSVSKYEWQRAKKIWKRDLKEFVKQFIYSKKLNESPGCQDTQITNWHTQFDRKQLLKELLKPRKDYYWLNGALFSDLLDFIKLHLNHLLMKQIIEYLKRNYIAEINKLLQKIQLDLQEQIPKYLKIPEFNKSSIALGIDDGQVYQLHEITDNTGLSVNIRLSVIAKQIETTELQTIDRYKMMIDKGFKAHRGVLCFSRSKYYLYIPFKKKVSEERASDLIASADLGLKTLATLSIFEKNKTSIKNQNQNKTTMSEIDRRFLDQKHLGGKKDEWFINRQHVNLKGKLMDHRLVARKSQSKRMQSRRGSKIYWFSRNIEKSKWKKIKNTHKEMIRQIATRIIAYLNYHNVGTLVLENLKWAKHSPKSQSGYFLASWQVHWFFSQVQAMLKSQAMLYGIKVELVNPRDSSKICCKCEKKGKRKGKLFTCISSKCKSYHLDSDLNAARNLIQRSKQYRRLISCQ